MFMNQIINIKMATLSKLIYRFNAVPVKIPAGVFAETGRPILKFTWKCQGSRIAETMFRKKNKVGRLILPHFKT